MDTQLIAQIFEICIIPILGILTTFLISWINSKKEALKQQTNSETIKKYIEMLDNTITDCVIAMNQTYVNSLKLQGKFDTEAQKKAFTDVYNKVIAILGQDAIEYLNSAIGDLNEYITSKIEKEVSSNKIPSVKITK